MKIIYISLTLISSFILSFSIVYAQCNENKDWPEMPCNDSINVGDPHQKPILGDKQDWQKYYELKGKDWMEMKKAEMYQAEKDKILKQWYEFGKDSNNMPNFDVWYYYNLYGQAPDIMKYYNGTVTTNVLKPIITYYYVSPGAIAMMSGSIGLLGFFGYRKYLNREKIGN